MIFNALTLEHAVPQLSYLGCDSSCARSLGQFGFGEGAVHSAMGYLLAGLRGETSIGDTCDFMHFHRDGNAHAHSRDTPCGSFLS